MPILQAIVLAIIQGVTEFLPISSSAHLALAPWLFGWQDQGLTFDIALHIGTLAAVLIYFARDWVQVIAQAFGRDAGQTDLRENRRLLWLLAAASVPAGVAGLLLKDTVETTLRSPYVMGTMLVAVGFLMMLGERMGRRDRGIGAIGWADALLIGAAQAVALIPGTSRSGITMTTGLFRHLDRHSAARFSFLLSTPITAAAAAKALYDLQKAGGVPPELRMHFALGIVLSAAVGCFVIGFLLRYLRSRGLGIFIYYRIAFGLLILALAYAKGVE